MKPTWRVRVRVLCSDCVPRSRSVLDQFDEALAEYKQMDKRAARNRSSVHSDRYFDNLAALLR